MNYDNTRVKIDLDIIQENFNAVARKAGVPVMAIVKADAYGHGAIQVARLLEGQCAFFGVSSMLEAMELRQAGLKTPILILGHTPPQAFPQAIQQGILQAENGRTDPLLNSLGKCPAGGMSQDQNWGFEPCLPQFHGFQHRADSEEGTLALQKPCHLNGTMPIGIGLHNGHHRNPGLFLHRIKIFLDHVKIDLDSCVVIIQRKSTHLRNNFPYSIMKRKKCKQKPGE